MGKIKNKNNKGFPKSAKNKTTKPLNPFEVHINREKVKILGKKTNNDYGLPGISRGKALKKRKDTLLREFTQRNKSNKFVDKRIERNLKLTDEDKAIVRFQAIREKAHKNSNLTLNEDEVLTHKGQSLMEIEKFDDPHSDDDEDSSDETPGGKLNAKFVENAHFGGGLLRSTGEKGAKTHKELIEQMIMESKRRKAEQQKTREITMEVTEALDKQWIDFVPLLGLKAKKDEVTAVKRKVDPMDKMLMEMKFEMRGIASDALKTDEQVAKEEQERLDKLEEERLRRMKGFMTDTGPNHRSADDLDDDFVYESDAETQMLTYGEEGEANVKVEAQMINVGNATDEEDGESGNSESEGSNESDEEGKEEADDSNGSEEKEEEEEEKEGDDFSDLDEESNEDEEEDTEEDKQGTHEMDVEEQIGSVEKESNDQEDESDEISVLIEKCNNPNLAQASKETLGDLFDSIVQQLFKQECSSIKTRFHILKRLAPHIHKVTKRIEAHVYNSVADLVKEKHIEYRKNPKKYPGPELAVLLKLVSIIFTTSDFRHQVVTSCFYFMDQMLRKCKVKNRKDLSLGIYLVTLVLEYTGSSKRFLPSAISFLEDVVKLAVPPYPAKKVNPQFKLSPNLLTLSGICGKLKLLKMESGDLETAEVTEEFKVRSLLTALKLVEEFDNQLAHLDSNLEIFENILHCCQRVPGDLYPKVLKNQLEKVIDQLEKRKNEKILKYVVMPHQRPKALRLLEPKIEQVFVGKRFKKHQSREKAERDKLMHKLKRETKGAMREIRRDRAFLDRVKIQQRIESDKERQEKVKKIFSGAAIQQSELNSLDRKKKRK